MYRGSHVLYSLRNKTRKWPTSPVVKIVQPKLSTQFNPVSSIHQVQQAVKTLMYEEPTTSVFSNLQKTRYQTIKYITKPSQNRPKRKLSNTVIYNTSQRSTQDEINKLLTQLVNK